MVLQLKNSDGKLVIKDILDIDLDMYVEKNEDKKGFSVVVNSKYTLASTFETEEEAEDAMIGVANARNDLENELRNC